MMICNLVMAILVILLIGLVIHFYNRQTNIIYENERQYEDIESCAENKTGIDESEYKI